VPDKGPGEFITLTELEAAQVEIEPGMAALIATGWDRMWDTPRFYWDSPRFSREAAEWLVSRQPSLLGVDITSIDGTTSPLKLLSTIFGSGCLLLAPLVNLRLVQQKYVDLVVLPIRLRGTCGAPCRAVAIEP
jgi:arylformamidase